MRRTCFSALAIFPLLVAALPAQRVWLSSVNSRQLGVDVHKAFFKASEGGRVGFASFAATIQGRFPVNEKLAVTVALPFARVSEEIPGFFDVPAQTLSESAIGDPWLGLEIATEPGIVVELGLRPGIASEDKNSALGLGAIGDFDRFEAWLPKTTTAHMIAHLGKIPDRGAFVTGIVGGTVAFPSGDSNDNPRTYASYGLRAGLAGGGLLSSATITGRAFLSGEGGTIGERTIHQLALNVESMRGGFRPNASIRVYIKEEFLESVSAILTLGGSFVF